MYGFVLIAFVSPSTGKVSKANVAFDTRTGRVIVRKDVPVRFKRSDTSQSIASDIDRGIVARTYRASDWKVTEGALPEGAIAALVRNEEENPRPRKEGGKIFGTEVYRLATPEELAAGVEESDDEGVRSGAVARYEELRGAPVGNGVRSAATTTNAAVMEELTKLRSENEALRAELGEYHEQKRLAAEAEARATMVAEITEQVKGHFEAALAEKDAKINELTGRPLVAQLAPEQMEAMIAAIVGKLGGKKAAAA